MDCHTVTLCCNLVVAKRIIPFYHCLTAVDYLSSVVLHNSCQWCLNPWMSRRNNLTEVSRCGRFNHAAVATATRYLVHCTRYNYWKRTMPNTSHRIPYLPGRLWVFLPQLPFLKRKPKFWIQSDWSWPVLQPRFRARKEGRSLHNRCAMLLSGNWSCNNLCWLYKIPRVLFFWM